MGVGGKNPRLQTGYKTKSGMIRRTRERAPEGLNAGRDERRRKLDAGFELRRASGFQAEPEIVGMAFQR